MSFDKHYPKRKDRRGQYHDSRRFDRSCRSHGDCPWCERNRKHANKRREPLQED